jgi:hypothetical protein
MKNGGFRAFLWSVGGRKILFGLLILIAACVYLERDKLTGVQWVDLVKWTGGFVTVSIGMEGAAASIGSRRDGDG